MSTTINITVGGNALLDQSRQQMQANRLGRLERDQDRNTEAKAAEQFEAIKRVNEFLVRPAQLRRRDPEPAATRYGDKDLRLEVRGSIASPRLYLSKVLRDRGLPAGAVYATGPFGDVAIDFANANDMPTGWVGIVDKTTRLVTGDSDFTFEAFFKLQANHADNVGIATLNMDIAQLAITCDSESKLSLQAGERSTGFVRNSYWSGPVIATGLWTHVAVVRSSGTLVLCVNGAAAAPAYYADPGFDPAFSGTVTDLSMGDSTQGYPDKHPPVVSQVRYLTDRALYPSANPPSSRL